MYTNEYSVVKPNKVDKVNKKVFDDDVITKK